MKNSLQHSLFFPSSTFHLLFQVDNENVRVIGGNFQLRKRSTFIEEWFSSQVRKVFLFKGTIDHFEGKLTTEKPARASMKFVRNQK